MGGISNKMVITESIKKTALIFPGQGAQEIGMGKELYETSPAARWVFDKANTILGMDIKSLCFNGPEEELMTTANSQPAIFVTSIATLNVLLEKLKRAPIGIENHEIFSEKDVPLAGTIALGMSLGEITALTAVCAITFEEGLTFVRNRGLFMEEASRLKEGKMASILGLSIDKVEEICKGVGCEVANLNCPDQVVISGEAKLVELAGDLAKAAGAKKIIMLKVSGAFHSKLMISAKEKLKKVLDKIKIENPAVDFISNISAEVTTNAGTIRENLANQLDHRTLWEASIRKAISLGYKDFLEIGPGSVLKGLLRKIDSSLNVVTLHTTGDIDNFIQNGKQS
ncbi:malonyl CoA-ACP transacylase [Candidatus Omnitrophus magneticus]|uniref:Malonyl CoA-acyl carrier protein transacylase n=1 Tax=Candidatus Omnitrophus magneticus TaxID=1609969 RepID=A0A0F0CUW6_9BACT|nr:malonyl CoA-ACP transacylase [Candidatus Omnitrophus magneticus]